MEKYSREKIENAYSIAKERFSAFGVDTEKAIKKFSEIPISLHNWQGDDVKGFENLGDVASQNLVTGNYKGAARNADEMRMDIDKAFSMSPCKPKVNLHSMYAEPKSKKDRNEYTAEDFENWINWAKEKGYGLDFNASYFTHPMMDNGFSLASRNKKVRDYWIEAGKKSRDISLAMAEATGVPCYNNLWIPDGLKDVPANRNLYRQYLKDSLDQIYEKEIDKSKVIDTMEGKLFAIGVESFTVGSHEFYLAYAAKNNLSVTMDTGHYHPTEMVYDKITSATQILDHVLLHISRGIRWDSDHVLIQSDELTSLMTEVKRANLFDKVGLGLDYFDASINRVAAWTIGLRAAGKALLTALLEPSDLLEKAEASGDFTTRLALTDEIRNLPVNAVWDMMCARKNVAVGDEWIDELKKYESDVQDKR